MTCDASNLCKTSSGVQTISRALCLLIFCSLTLAALPATAEPLTLRVNDAEGRSGERVALVVRTYAPRGVGQGQLCFRVQSQLEAIGGMGPFEALEEFIVWSSAGDAIFDGAFDPQTQTAILDFSSLSGSINLEDGAMAAMIFRLRDDLPPESTFQIGLDGLESFLFDDQGQPLPLELRAGDLDILPAASAYTLSAEGDAAGPGEVAQLGVSTQEIFPLVQGQIAFQYDPSIATNLPTVTVDGRHGQATFTIDQTQPGRVLVGFQSPDQSLNTIPGQFIKIDLPLRPDLPIGTTSTVSILASHTSLVGPTQVYHLELEGDLIEVVPAETLFTDGFESGDVQEWSSHSP